MSEENYQQNTPKVSENIGNKTALDFEALHNLVGIFSILLEVDKRKNPQKYLTYSNKTKTL